MEDDIIEENDKNYQMEKEYDVIVVGGGPAGLTASIRCRNHHLSTMLVEGRKLGGQINQLYPTKYILDYSSYPEIRAGYLADLMIHHARYKGVPMVEETIVESIDKDGKFFHVKTNRGEVKAKAMILAIGMGLFEPMALGIPGEKEFRDRGVYYAVPNMDIYRGQNLLVVGGGDTAVENAIGLSRVAKVTLIHRKEKLRAIESNLEILERSLIEVVTSTELKEIKGDDQLRSVIIHNNKNGTDQELEFDGVVINIGFSPDLSLVENAGVKNDGGHIIVTGPNMHTNVPGIFACGDIVEYEGKNRQVHPAAGEGVIASEEAYKFIKSPYWIEKADGGVEVDKENCVSCGACMAICPDVFGAGPDRKSVVKEEADLSLPCVDKAIEACPRKAIERT
ncbi:MAG: FAD-dependent oxidoreductase [Thermoplasmatota archaeon]